MKFGIFEAPFSVDYMNGSRSQGDVIKWDLKVTQMAEQYGLSEVFFAEHHTVSAEPGPAPDLMIAAASQLTSTISLGAAAHLLPYHHPVALAHRMIVLDHMTDGRYIAGVAPGAFATDAQLFGSGKENNKMMVEALGMIEAVMTKEAPFKIDGEYWQVDMPVREDGIHGQHFKPRSTGPRMAMTGMQPQSPTLTIAGGRGYIPMSQQVSDSVLVQHWETYSNAAEEAGHTPERTDWRVMRDYFVAETDKEAREAVLSGPSAEVWSKYLLPTFHRFNLAGLLAGPGVDPADVDIEWIVDNFWMVGSPGTVCDKIAALKEGTGGVGTVLAFGYDWSAQADVFERHLRLMADEVIPKVQSL